jgi:hypothetical protein
MEFVSGVALTAYGLVAGFLLYEPGAKDYGVWEKLAALTWPISLPILFVSGRIYKRWKYERRMGDRFNDYKIGTYLRRGRGVNDGPREMFIWFKDRLTGKTA